MGWPRAEKYRPWLLLTLIAAFLAGISHLMMLRFKGGDVYPAYSTLRSDPLGCRVFFESLKSLDGIRVTRNLRRLRSLEPDPDGTLFVIGATLRPGQELPLGEARALDEFMSSGGRVVVTLRPISGNTDGAGVRNPDADSDPAGGADGNRPGRPPEPKTGGSGPRESGKAQKPSRPASGSDTPKERATSVSPAELWGITLSAPERRDAEGGGLNGHAAAQTSRLSGVVPWHSPMYFTAEANSWETLFAVDGRAVMVERMVGSGSLVMATDSYFISNEALKSDRFTELLVYLIGGNRNVMVDEAHHGIRRQTGVIGYLRRHRLHWILIALLAVAGLFVWRNAVSLVPPSSDSRDGPPAMEQTRDAARGLTLLLQRNIPPGRLLGVCLKQWERTFEKSPRFPAVRRERARRAVEGPAAQPAAKTDPVRGYRAISRVLAEDRRDE